jgi:hypothetical protein
MSPSDPDLFTVSVVLRRSQVASLDQIREARLRQTGSRPSVSALLREALSDFAAFHGYPVKEG